MNKAILTSMLAMAWLAPLAADAQNRSAREVNPHGLDYSDVTMDLPDYDEPFQRDGVRVPPAQILQVKPGIDAGQVRTLLGEPLSSGTGSRGPEWDYHLKLDLADEDYIVCQYKVVFEAGGERVREAVWRRYQCRLAMEAAAARLAPRHVELAGDFLFDFDKDALSAQGAMELDRLASEILAGGRSTTDIVGHTDRLGSRAYNQALSERRARTVAEYLAGRGVPADGIRTSGRGPDMPAKACEGTRSTPELRACLAPNRRVSITVTPAG